MRTNLLVAPICFAAVLCIPSLARCTPCVDYTSGMEWLDTILTAQAGSFSTHIDVKDGFMVVCGVQNYDFDPPYDEFWDVSDPFNPTRLWSGGDILDPHHEDCVIINATTYAIANEEELQVKQPGIVNYGIISERMRKLAVHDGYLFGTFGRPSLSRLHIFDVSNPQSPVEIGQLDTDGGSSCGGIAFHGDYVYYGVDETIHVADITDLMNPTAVGYIATGLPVLDLKVFEQTLVAAQGPELVFYDLATPAVPTRLSSVTDPYGPEFATLSITGTTAFCNGLTSISIANPANPTVLGHGGIGVTEVIIADGYAFGLAGDGVTIASIDDPVDDTLPTTVDTDGGVVASALENDRIYLLYDTDERLRTLDAVGFDEVALLDLSPEISRPRRLSISGTAGLVTDWDEGYTLDLSIPDAPALGVPLEAGFVVGSDGTLFFTYDGDGMGLRVFDLSDPLAPIERGSTPPNIEQIVSADAHYSREDGLLVMKHGYWGPGPTFHGEVIYFDLSDPDNPTGPYSHIATPFPASAGVIANGRHYGVQGRELVTMGLDNLSAPVPWSAVLGPNLSGPLRVVGSSLYAATGTSHAGGGGIARFDLSNPNLPAYAGSVPIGERVELRPLGVHGELFISGGSYSRSNHYTIALQCGVASATNTGGFDPLSLRVHPNPMSTSTEISWFNPEAQTTTVGVYSTGGRRLRTVFEGPATGGDHRVVWDGTTESGQGLQSGIYFLRIETRSLSRRSSNASFQLQSQCRSYFRPAEFDLGEELARSGRIDG